VKRLPVQVVPLIVGPANARAATGWPWRWCRDFWESRGRSFVGQGRKRGIPAAELLAELSRTDAAALSVAPAPPADPAERVRRELGLSRRAS
jgi:hypothetical protein